MNKKFTVIIPTLWMSEIIYDSLDQLSKCIYVGEVIIIDNDPTSSARRDSYIKSLNKIKVHKKEENIYVNNAWNYGVNNSKHDNLCILNDDVTFDISKTLSFLRSYELKEYGLIGTLPPGESSRGDIYLEKAEEKDGFSCEVFFIHKENYPKIPECLKIWFGDDWLFQSVDVAHYIRNINLRGDTGTSVKGYSDVITRDIWMWKTKIRPHLIATKSDIPYSVAYPSFRLMGMIRYVQWRADSIRMKLKKNL